MKSTFTERRTEHTFYGPKIFPLKSRSSEFNAKFKFETDYLTACELQINITSKNLIHQKGAVVQIIHACTYFGFPSSIYPTT